MRLERIDALRGCAVFGILLVNVWGFVYGYASLRYGVGDAATSGLDRAAVFIVAAFAEQKFYPIFAFLFGAGFALSARRAGLAQFRAGYPRRLQWLLAVGLLHGTLIWLGDILTAYAIAGYWLLGKAGRRPRQLLASLRRVVIVNLVLMVVIVASHAWMPPMGERMAESRAMFAIYTGGAWEEIALARLADFGLNMLNLFFFLPWVALFFLLGVLAVRLGPLVRPARHARLWRRLLGWSLGLALPLNLWWGYVAMRVMAEPLQAPAGAEAAALLVNVAGPALACAYVAAFMLAGQGTLARLVRWLAPAGRMALTLYLSQSVLLMLLLQGFALGLGARLPRAGLIGVCLGIMALQIVFSRWWMSRHRQGPLEAVWRAYAGRPRAAAADGKIAG